jgi:hypothetical protein
VRRTDNLTTFMCRLSRNSKPQPSGALWANRGLCGDSVTFTCIFKVPYSNLGLISFRPYCGSLVFLSFSRRMSGRYDIDSDLFIGSALNVTNRDYPLKYFHNKQGIQLTRRR